MTTFLTKFKFITAGYYNQRGELIESPEMNRSGDAPKDPYLIWVENEEDYNAIFSN